MDRWPEGWGLFLLLQVTCCKSHRSFSHQHCSSHICMREQNSPLCKQFICSGPIRPVRVLFPETHTHPYKYPDKKNLMTERGKHFWSVLWWRYKVIFYKEKLWFSEQQKLTPFIKESHEKNEMLLLRYQKGEAANTRAVRTFSPNQRHQ